jgi:hypothetical protein
MYFAMVLLAKWGLQFWIMISARSMVQLNAKNAWHDRQSQTLTFFSPDLSACRSDWILVFHAL